MVTPSWKLLNGLSQDDQVVGIDEVGRGAWAGPVTAAAVLMRFGEELDGVRDSKTLSPKKRTQLDRIIRSRAVSVGIGWSSAHEIDLFGLSWAVEQAGRRALSDLSGSYQKLILDGVWNYLSDNELASVIVKADALVTPVAAASVIAKVARDRYMERLDRGVIQYGFSSHRGYMTPDHRRQVELHGMGPWHRRRWSYTPSV